MRHLLWAFAGLFIAVDAEAQTFDWVRTAGPIAFDAGMGLAQSAGGDLYAAGLFTDALSFGDTTLISPGGWRAFLVKLSANGDALWARQFDSIDPDMTLAATNDAVYLAGSFSGTITVGNTSLTSAGSTDVVVVRFDNSGHPIWARRAGGTQTDLAGDLTLDSAGQPILCGGFRGSANFGGIILSSAGGEDAFVTRISPAGTTEWARRLGGAQDQFASGIGGIDNGGYVVAGSFRGSFTLGGTSLASAGGDDVWVARFSSDGVAQWAASAGGSDDEFPYGFCARSDGSAAITGFFLGQASFGANTLTSSGDRDAFIARLGPDGSFAWAARAGGSGLDNGLAASFDPSGRLAATGFFSGTADFQGTSLMSDGPRDLFIASYTESGSLEWVLRAGGNGADGASRVVHDAVGRTYLAGSIDQAALFGGIDVPADGTTLFVTRVIDPLSQIELVSSNKASGAGDGLRVSPNPCAGRAVTVSFASDQAIGDALLLLDAAGRRIALLSPRPGASPRSAAFALPTTLPAGVYLLFKPGARRPAFGRLTLIR